MERLARSIRLIIGLGMVAAGTTLTAPTGLVVAEWAQSANTPSSPASPAAASAAERPSAPASVSAGELTVPAATSGLPPVWLPQAQAAAGGEPAVVRDAYQPPVPPAPLPPPAGSLAAAGPDLSVAYRSTLEVPPPPLIDGQRPPPMAVGWTARSDRDPAPSRAPLPPPSGSYRVRDGDDLTGIAIRFYGTPAAARLIWEANRGRLADPALLPIGIELALPHPGAGGTAADTALEPAVGPPVGPSPAPAPGGSPWLGSAS